MPQKDFLRDVGDVPCLDYSQINMALSADDSVYVAGVPYSNLDNCLVKISKEGTLLWNIAVPDMDYMARLAVDGDGNAYVPNTDYAVAEASILRYGTNGTFQGKALLPIPAGAGDPSATSAAFDRARGILYGAGTYYDENGRYTGFIAAYDAGLNLLESRVIGAVEDDAIVSVDAEGNVYAGTVVWPMTGSVYLAAKYTPRLAQEEWSNTAPYAAARFGTQGNTADPNGGLVFKGDEYDEATNQSAVVLRRVSAGGGFSGPVSVPGVFRYGGFDDQLSVDGQSAAYMYGYDPNWNLGLIKADAAGTLAWGATILSEDVSRFWPIGFTVGADKKIYMLWGGDPPDCGYVCMARYSQGSADSQAPAAVTDLRATQTSTTSVTLAWTAPGDDGTAGTAQSYDLRYTSAAAILTDTDFSSAQQAAGVPAPKPAGAQESFTLSGLQPATTYYFALKAKDEAGNIAGLSNSLSTGTSALPRGRMTISSGNEQVGLINESLSLPLSVKVANGQGNAVSGAQVNLAISSAPTGATGQVLSVVSAQTNEYGIATSTLTLGDIPADYQVTALCPDCAETSSSVVFTVWGKLNAPDFKQYDSRWKDDIYDTHPASKTIEGRGCALTSIAILHNYFRERYSLAIPSTTPKDLNRYLTKNGGFDANADLYFDRIGMLSQDKVRYHKRVAVGENMLMATMLAFADGDILKGLPVVFHIPSETPAGHFLVGVGKRGGKYIVTDPGRKNRIFLDPAVTTVLDIRRFKRGVP
ncbi:MAG: fibronectin type III domain-containing protein [Elusimicrobiota bacterium]